MWAEKSKFSNPSDFMNSAPTQLTSMTTFFLKSSHKFSRVLFCEREDSFDDVYFEKGQKEIVRWFFS